MTRAFSKDKRLLGTCALSWAQSGYSTSFLLEMCIYCCWCSSGTCEWKLERICLSAISLSLSGPCRLRSCKTFGGHCRKRVHTCMLWRIICSRLQQVLTSTQKINWVTLSRADLSEQNSSRHSSTARSLIKRVQPSIVCPLLEGQQETRQIQTSLVTLFRLNPS